MSRTRIPAALRERVADQAGHRCGYCLTTEAVIGMAMEIDHLIPETRGGRTAEGNLWLACPSCNAAKAARVTAIDPTTGQTVPLFNPRRDRWSEHFTWAENGDTIVGRTPTGRATVLALRMNRPLVVRARRLWVRLGVHPQGEQDDEE